MIEDEEDDEPECNFGLATRTVVARDRPSTPLTIKVDQPKPISNFAAAFARMHDERQKRTSPDSEDNPRETRRRKSTESGDSTDNEIATGTAILDLNSPENPTTVSESRYEEYFTIEGQKAKFKKTAEPRTNVFDRLGPAWAEDDEILAEALEADRRDEEELQAQVKRMENDRREQERKQWEEEARIREQQRAKREAERAKKSEVFRDTAEYEQVKGTMTRQTILKDPMPPGFSQLPAKRDEPESAGKKGHRSTGKSGGRFVKPPEKTMLVGFFNLRKFRYNKLYSEPNIVIAWAEMSLNLDHMNREVTSLGFFEKPGEKTREIMALVKYALICGIDGYRNVMVQWPSWVADTHRPMPHYAPTPIPPTRATMQTDIRVKAHADWEYHLSWLQHWNDALDTGRDVYYGGARQSDSRLVVTAVYLLNHVLDNPLKIEEIKRNTGWQLCRPYLDANQTKKARDREREDAQNDLKWRTTNWKSAKAMADETYRQFYELVKMEIEQCKHQGEQEKQTKKEKAEKYEQHRKNLSHQRGLDNARPPASSKDRGSLPVKIDRERAAGKSANTLRSEIHVVEMEKRIPTTKAKSAIDTNKEEEMEVELEENLHDALPGYLLNLRAPSGNKLPAEISANRRRPSTGMPQLEDVPEEERTGEGVGGEAEVEESSSSTSSGTGSCSCSSSSSGSGSDSEEDEESKDEPSNGGEINEEAYNEPDPSYLLQLQSEEAEAKEGRSHLEQLEIEYRGRVSTREEMHGVQEAYHATPNVNDDDLLKGEAMDASPRTETALLAETADTLAVGVNCGITEEETLAAVASIHNPSMPTEAEFLNTDVDMEESPESFDALSHCTPHLPDIPEKKPPTTTDRTPKKKQGRHSNKGRKQRR